MKSLSFKEPWVSRYVERLLRLSAATKRAIIKVLEGSLKGQDSKPPKKTPRSRSPEFLASIGGWQGDGTAEELAASIRNARTINPEREPF